MNNYTLNLKISGITCESCIKLIKKKIGKLDGVSDVIIQGNNGETSVQSANKLNVLDIVTALKDTPYQVKSE